ncbi:MAG: AgmX/PglI C-terminal domain-containing protein [Deltaproteobacteria bacterium]|nr:AgmX/PglI C-terminal domain-containing protein [Deltaproteobacteria bacterium]MBI4374158.1 AgmX/PglI C-terminal domain-containing protein [Deltaproteobacteria bacterium]
MKESIKIILLTITVMLLAGLFFFRFESPENHYPLFMDQRGGVVDPYLQREVKNTIMAHAGEIQGCYNQLLERSGDPAKTEGTVHLDWMIDAKGNVQQTRVIYSQIPDNDFGTCIRTAIDHWRFPPPGTSRYAEHTFSFSKGVKSFVD